jgi:deoxyadenosine/deoxycytidine kinase
MLLGRYRHIAVEGPIGVGKSSLARKLAEHLGARLLLERAEENPYLERFYADPPRYALQTQLAFLLQRARQVQELAQPGMFDTGVVSDFVFAKDAIFARLTLSDDEHRLYTRLAAEVLPQAPQPDLVVWLQASPATLLARIRTRGLPMEQGIEERYLQRLCDAYVDHFAPPDGAPVLAVVTDELDPLRRPADFDRLLDGLRAFEGRRQVLEVR